RMGAGGVDLAENRHLQIRVFTGGEGCHHPRAPGTDNDDIVAEHFLRLPVTTVSMCFPRGASTDRKIRIAPAPKRHRKGAPIPFPTTEHFPPHTPHTKPDH